MTSNSEVNDYKFALILNKKVEPGVAFNAAAHMTAALMAKASPEQKESMKFLDYQDADNQIHLTSGLSLIVLKAKNSNKIQQAKVMAKDNDLLYVDFLESMTGGTYIEQMERTKNIPEAELNYYGLCVFGPKAEVESVTSKFSLWN